MKTTTQRWIYFPANRFFIAACANASVRGMTLSQSAGELARLNADAYLMGGEL
jgi:hypothetical protein